ncbi:MAG TPA: hypothetical protein VFM18_15380, partial [Methanosarcina sp.]|nr:hypothetical protein [Methanosarcina sp.]
QTSMSNDILSQIVRLDRQMATGRLVITLKDLSGNSLIDSDEAYIETLPDAHFSKQLQDRPWKIVMLSTRNFFIGSNVKYGEKDLFSN